MADTLRALDAAVQAHIAENFPGAVTDSWVLVTHSNGLQDDDHDLHNYRMISALESRGVVVFRARGVVTATG